MRNAHPILQILVVLLSLAGLADSLYFTLAYYGRVRKSRWVPEILCAREGSACVTVVQTPYARVFGVPNSLLGFAYYLLVIAWAVWGQTWAIALGQRLIFFSIILLALSVGSVVVGLYLIYELRVTLQIDCPMCYTAHAINAVLLVLLIASI